MASLTRDTILGRALDMIGAPALNTNDRPAGTIVANALSVGWLQDALNLFADEFPWAQLIKTQAITITSAAVVSQPADFILDVRNGIYLPVGGITPGGRIRRTSFQKFLSYQTSLVGPGSPRRYCVVSGAISIWPTPDQSYSATLAYYSRPTALVAGTIPTFPSDLPLIEYVRMRGLEWIRAIEVGTALKYTLGQIADLRKSGLGMEPEDDTIPFDPDQFIPAGDPNVAGWGWMGLSSDRI